MKECPKCKELVEDNLNECPRCGCFIIEENTENKNEEQNIVKDYESAPEGAALRKNIFSSMSKSKKIGLCAIFCAMVLVIVFFATPDLRNYMKAKSLMNSEKYSEAKIIFYELKSYKDSRMKIKECNYQIALNYIEEKKYNHAIEILEKMPLYKESKDKIYFCKYENAKLLCQEGSKDSLKKAIKLFKELSDFKYKDSSEQYKKTKYILGTVMLEEASYEDAINELQNINYQDSEELFKKATYELGKIRLEEGSYEEARELFRNIGYQDSGDLFLKSTYELGKKHLEEGSYDKAIGLLDGLNYEDSQELVNEVLNGETSLNQFIARYNAMADNIMQKQNVKIDKLSVDNILSNRFTTGTGASITLNNSCEEIDYRYKVNSFMWYKRGWIFMDEMQVTGEFYCSLAGLIPGSTYDSIGKILTSLLESSGGGYGSLEIGEYFINHAVSKAELSISGQRN